MACFSSRPSRPRHSWAAERARPLLKQALALLAVSLVAGACSGGGGDRAAPEGPAAATTAPGSAGFALTAADLHAMAPQAPAFAEDWKAGVKSSLDTWLGNGVVGPLSTGKPPAGLEGVFTAPALGRLAAPGPDRAALLEEGAPLKGEVRQERANAGLTALTAPGGEVVLVTALVDVALTVSSGDGKVAVSRVGELVLVPDNGVWRIDAYDLRTARDTQPAGGR